MKAPEEKILIDGPIGKIDVIMERPDAPRGIALIAHPHPLGGGANTNKVAYTLARTFVGLGYATFRPNFRGVGGTEGTHDEGRGETDDLLAVLHAAKNRCGDIPVALAGFSFGAFCQTQSSYLSKLIGWPIASMFSAGFLRTFKGALRREMGVRCAGGTSLGAAGRRFEPGSTDRRAFCGDDQPAQGQGDDDFYYPPSAQGLAGG